MCKIQSRKEENKTKLVRVIKSYAQEQQIQRMRSDNSKKKKTGRLVEVIGRSDKVIIVKVI